MLSRISEPVKRWWVFVFFAAVILMLLVLLARNIFAPADNAVQGGAGETVQQPAVPSVTATAAGRGDHKCDVPVALIRLQW